MASEALWPPSRFEHSQFARREWERLDYSVRQSPGHPGPHRAPSEDADRRSSGRMRNMEIAVLVSSCGDRSTCALASVGASKSRRLFLAGRPLLSSRAAAESAPHTNGLALQMR